MDETEECDPPWSAKKPPPDEAPYAQLPGREDDARDRLRKTLVVCRCIKEA